MNSAPMIQSFVLALSVLGGSTSPSVAQESRWGAPDEDTVKMIIAVGAKWSNSNCNSQSGLKDVIADDFQRTYTNGQRYGKAEAITTDPALAKLSRDCQLGEVKVRFFGDSIAIVYGAENRISKDKDGKEAKRCQLEH
ncbi:MAG: nuclear transport factor 2 family protein [Bacillota bacterium]